MFKTNDRAAAFMQGIETAELYHFAADSITKDNYIKMLERFEGYFDEDYAEQFPFMVTWIE